MIASFPATAPHRRRLSQTLRGGMKKRLRQKTTARQRHAMMTPPPQAPFRGQLSSFYSTAGLWLRAAPKGGMIQLAMSDPAKKWPVAVRGAAVLRPKRRCLLPLTPPPIGFRCGKHRRGGGMSPPLRAAPTAAEAAVGAARWRLSFILGRLPLSQVEFPQQFRHQQLHRATRLRPMLPAPPPLSAGAPVTAGLPSQQMMVLRVLPHRRHLRLVPRRHRQQHPLRRRV